MTSAPETLGSSSNVSDANSRDDRLLPRWQWELFKIERGCLGQIREGVRFSVAF
jgi:hypothetical protein